ANGSWDSIRARPPADQPSFVRALRLAGMGPVPMIAGSTPAVAQETMRASGRRPRLAAASAVISTTAAAPSLMPEALPAVTVPFLSNAGRSFEIGRASCRERVTSGLEVRGGDRQSARRSI